MELSKKTKQPLKFELPDKAGPLETKDAGLRRFLGYRLKRAYNIFRSDMLERLEPLGLRITTFSSLLLVVQNPGLRQSELASALDIKTSNMVAIIDDLENRKWIKRKPVPVDRRALALFATAAGKNICKRAELLTFEHEEKLLNLTEAELNTLSILLEKIESSTEK